MDYRDMMANARPCTTDELVRRLRDAQLSSKEREALNVLCGDMITIFNDEPRSSFATEAAMLSNVVSRDNYSNFLTTFSKAIINGTADGNLPDGNILIGFITVLRHRPDHITSGNVVAQELGPLLASLHHRLERAMEQSSLQTKFQLTYAIGIILDTMNDFKTSGLSREALHEPLRKNLDKLSKDKEPRLAQAASYACQALLSIPNDEAPYQALWRVASDITSTGLKIAGGVTAMNPSQLFDGIIELENIPSLISSMIEVVADVTSLSAPLSGGLDPVKKQKQWYTALRFTHLLIRSEAFESLADFLSKVPCNDKEEFLCGLFAQLEQAWLLGTQSQQKKIFGFCEEKFLPFARQTNHQHVFQWITLVSATLKCQWEVEKEENQHQSRFRKYFKKGGRETPKPLSTIEPWKPIVVKTQSLGLLTKAWKNPSGYAAAQVFYADREITSYYVDGVDRVLLIERLSEEHLSMEQCYINLEIVKGAGESSNGPKVEDSGRKSLVDLDKIFEPQQIDQGPPVRPTLIFIQGHAGVGKSTLCKKIVHSHIYDKLWLEDFDRVLWIPLRRLKGRSTFALDVILRELFFIRNGISEDDKKVLSKALADTIKSNPSRTLFVFDGLDEIAADFDSTNPSVESLRKFLDQSCAIITSRPHGMNLIRTTAGLSRRDLQTVGFSQSQVEKYVTNTMDKEPGKAVISFLRQHPIVQELACIPVQLDALCYCWEKTNMSTIGLADVPTTMTSLYQIIERTLWQKDMLRMDSSIGGKTQSDDNIRAMLPPDIERAAKSEINHLQTLAFTGLCNNVVEFDASYQTKIMQHFPSLTTSSPDLAKLSFLRTSTRSSIRGPRTYHFLHLTYQEYFAAKYFFAHWKKPKTPIRCLDVVTGEIEEIDPEDFLLQRKYRPNLTIFWRFVSGLADGAGVPREGESELFRFFRVLEAEPRDILGLVHQRLVMYCFAEVKQAKSATQLRKDFETQLSRWLLFEARNEPRLHRGLLLSSYAEFPGRLVVEVLSSRIDENIKLKILRSLRYRPSVPSDIIAWAHNSLRNREFQDSRLKTSIIEMMGYDNFLPEEVVKDLLLELFVEGGDDRTVSDSQGYDITIFDVLCSQNTLPETILQQLTTELSGEGQTFSAELVNSASNGRSERRNLSILDDARLRCFAIRVLGLYSNLPTSTLMLLAKQIENSNEDVKCTTAKVLTAWGQLSDEVLEYLVTLLRDQSDYGKFEEMDGHEVDDQSWPSLEETGDVPKGFLGELYPARPRPSPGMSERDFTQVLVIRVVCSQPALSENIQKHLASRLRNRDWHFKRITAKGLGKHKVLGRLILDTMVYLLSLTRDEDGERIATAAAKLLRRQQCLSKDITAKLDEWESANREQALLDRRFSFASSHNLDSDTDDADSRTRLDFLEAQSHHTALLGEDLSELVTVFDITRRPNSIRRIMEIFARQPSLPENVLRHLVSESGARKVFGCYDLWIKCVEKVDLFSEEVLGQLASWMYEGYTRIPARAIYKRRELYDLLLQNRNLWFKWMRWSLREKHSWYFNNRTTFCIEGPEGLVKIDLESDEQVRKFKEGLRKLWKRVKHPFMSEQLEPVRLIT